MRVQAPIITVLDLEEPCHKEILFLLSYSSLLESYLQTEDKVEQLHMLLFDSCNYGGVYTGHDHWVEEFLIYGELLIRLLFLAATIMLTISIFITFTLIIFFILKAIMGYLGYNLLHSEVPNDLSNDHINNFGIDLPWVCYLLCESA